MLGREAELRADPSPQNMPFLARRDNKMSNYPLTTHTYMDISKVCLMGKGNTRGWESQFSVTQSEACGQVSEEKWPNFFKASFPGNNGLLCLNLLKC